MVKSISKIMTWEFILVSFIAFLAMVLLSGCSTFVSAKIGETTYETGVWIERTVETNEVQRDD